MAKKTKRARGANRTSAFAKANIKIERNIPLAPIRHRDAQYPFEDMVIGDSFPLPKGASVAVLRYLASRCGKQLNAVFTVRRHGASYRCWRVE